VSKIDRGGADTSPRRSGYVELPFMNAVKAAESGES
jgi:hypothetical protein